jgi:2-polyprenyl-3-methyl-5-hydroxy-6-metoxy-1,4-benzoquinol methylase
MRKDKDEALDQAQVEAFLERVIANAGGLAITILTAIGDRFGLFKDLDALGPATSAELAARTGIHERYAREWLYAMRSAGYLEYDPAQGRFFLPAANAPVLAHEDGPFFQGDTHQMLFGMMSILGSLEQAFQTGDGISMSAYHDTMWEGLERHTFRAFQNHLIQNWIPAMPEVQRMLRSGARVADIGCGSGRALILMAQAFPDSRYIGFDLFEPLVERAAANAQAAGVAERVQFQALDGAWGLPEQYDIITTFDVVHDAPDPLQLLRTIHQGLRAQGRYVCTDIKCPDNWEENVGPLASLRYGYSLFYCMSTSLANGGPGLGTVGLPESKMVALCKEAGFASARLVPLEQTPYNLFEACP